MKVSHSNTLWLGYKLYSSFVLHGRITLLPLPTLPLGRHHSLQHPCYHYLADSCITYEPYTVLLILGKVLGGITDQHSESRCFVFLSQVFVLSPFFHFFYLSFSPSLFSILLFFLSFFIRSIHYFLLFLLFIPSFPVLCILCSYFLSLCPLFLSFVLSFFLSSIHSFVLTSIHSFSLSISLVHSFFLSLLPRAFLCSFVQSFILSTVVCFVRSFIHSFFA